MEGENGVFHTKIACVLNCNSAWYFSSASPNKLFADIPEHWGSWVRVSVSTSNMLCLESVLFSDLYDLELYKVLESQGHHIQLACYPLHKSEKRLGSKWYPLELFNAQPAQLFTVVLTAFLMMTALSCALLSSLHTIWSRASDVLSNA